MSSLERYLAANERFAADPFPQVSHLPSGQVAVVTCMDCRMHPEQFLGLEHGEAHVIRNAGGSAEDALRSLIVSQQLLGTRTVLVIKHTGCGMQNDVAAALNSAAAEHGSTLPHVDWHDFTDLEEAVRGDVSLLRDHPALVGTAVHGLIFDVADGTLRVVA